MIFNEGHSNLPLAYFPQWIGASEEALLYAELRDKIEWRLYQPRAHEHRMECMFNRTAHPYYSSYGVPATFATQEEPYGLSQLWDNLESAFSTKFGVCFINRFLSSDSYLNWHKDNSVSIDQSKPIVVVSLGSAGKVRFRPSNDHQNEMELSPAPGSLYIMFPHMQEAFDHTSSGNDEGRLSLVFRALSGVHK